MAKKARKPKRSGSRYTQQISQKETLLLQLQLASVQHDWSEMVDIARKLLNNFSLEPEQRVAVLGTLGTAYAGLNEYEQAYEALTEALAINPDDPHVLYERGTIAWRASRSGQYACDIERAAELIGSDKTHSLARAVQIELKKSRKLLKEALRKRGSDFTLDQLIEQQELYVQAFKRTAMHDWAGAELLFKRVIGMAEKDFDPRPWNNLGLCLMRQGRFDEAELAWKRALKIDRSYQIARNHLLLLPELRRGEKIASGRYVDDFSDGKGKLKLILEDEE
jgi:Flp pilus assembly protein TadD